MALNSFVFLVIQLNMVRNMLVKPIILHLIVKEKIVDQSQCTELFHDFYWFLLQIKWLTPLVYGVYVLVLIGYLAKTHENKVANRVIVDESSGTGLSDSYAPSIDQT